MIIIVLTVAAVYANHVTVADALTQPIQTVVIIVFIINTAIRTINTIAPAFARTQSIVKVIVRIKNYKTIVYLRFIIRNRNKIIYNILQSKVLLLDYYGLIYPIFINLYQNT